jgi:hypothetical protein
MKTYIIDWGKNANGGRFAIIQAVNIERAFWDADSIGFPFKIAELKIPKDPDGVRYVEIEAASTYCGSELGRCGSFTESFEYLENLFKA